MRIKLLQRVNERDTDELHRIGAAEDRKLHKYLPASDKYTSYAMVDYKS